MVKPLRKRRPDGSLYRRRREVEKELEDFEKLELPTALARAREGERSGKTTVSSEALVYILRREARIATARSPALSPIDGFVQILIQRAEVILRRHLWRLGDIDREEICKQVTDRIVDEIYEDSDLADYAEVNFNDWLRHNRLDAFRNQKRKIERMDRFGDSVDIAEDEAQVVPEDIDDKADSGPTPEAAYASSEAYNKAGLPPCIEDAALSPEDRDRIAAMVRRANLPPDVRDAFLLYHYLDMQIESEDPEKYTLVKHFGKCEKTIRLWIKRAEAAFTKLRGMKHESEPNEASEPGFGVARVSH
ncbi:MAG: P-loop NTPase family protein [Acidobacteriaceae bacterium]